MANAPANSFIVDFYSKNERILSLNVEYFNEYVAALKASNYVEIKGSTYSIKEIIMKHVTEEKGMKIELIVNLG